MYGMSSGPTSFIEINSQQYESDSSSRQMSYVDTQIPPQLPPKTPIRTPVMGTKTIHRRTLSNSSNNRNYGNDPTAVDPRVELDYRFNNFNITNDAITRDTFQYHSVPYNNNYPDQHEIPNRMRLYENISHFQHNYQSSSLPPSHCQTPIKTSAINDTTSSVQQQEQYKSPISMSNAEKRKMFFEAVTAIETTKSNDHQVIVSEANISNNTSRINSTGCTPTHSTPQDSFSDDSSYLSALASARFSPENFLSETIAAGRIISAANASRSIARRTVELDDPTEKS